MKHETPIDVTFSGMTKFPIKLAQPQKDEFPIVFIFGGSTNSPKERIVTNIFRYFGYDQISIQFDASEKNVIIDSFNVFRKR